MFDPIRSQSCSRLEKFQEIRVTRTNTPARVVPALGQDCKHNLQLVNFSTMGAIAVSFQNRLTGSSGTVCILNIGSRTLEFVRKKKKRKEESEIRIRNGCSNFRIFL